MPADTQLGSSSHQTPGSAPLLTSSAGVRLYVKSTLQTVGPWQAFLNSRCGAVSASRSYETSDYITESTFSLTIVVGLIFNYSRDSVLPFLSPTESNTSHTLQKCSPDY